ncbi:hypothetical protein NA23_05185 [Fervidobacterium islandicum]|uniref:DUF4129 domain-containing protein n=1 Tax=Fervidobacterium islandicum TaxID=2423 RepID=A0AAI8GD81_FERIS|nr:hypothetical protein [Fervidobacterium islandicum]AMW32727.1 hypothetical protein NA23_05185 [Fervidobacterium islandicum]
MGKYKKMNETLRNILILASIILSLTMPSAELFGDLHFWVLTMLLAIYALLKSKIISRIFLALSALYALSFFKTDSIKYLFVIVLLALSIKERIQNRWLTIALYFSALAFFNHYLSFIFVISFVLLNFADLPQFKNIFEDKLRAKKVSLIIVIFVVFLLLPLPDVRFDIVKVVQSREGAVSENSAQQKEEYTIRVPVNGSKNLSNQVSETAEGNNPSFVEKIENLARERLFKLLETLSMVAITIGLLYVLTITMKAPKDQRRSIISSFWVTVVVLLFFMFVLAPTIFDIIGNLKSQGTLESESMAGNSSYQQGHATSVVIPEEVRTSATSPKTNFDDALFIFQILATVSGLFAVLLLGKLYYDFLIQKTTEEEQTENTLVNQPVVYQTHLSYDEILTLSGAEFVHHAYHFVRQNLFKGLDHLTPYELLDKFDIPELRDLTVKYVDVEYAFKIEVTQKDIENIKSDFIKLVEHADKLFQRILSKQDK